MNQHNAFQPHANGQVPESYSWQDMWQVVQGQLRELRRELQATPISVSARQALEYRINTLEVVAEHALANRPTGLVIDDRDPTEYRDRQMRPECYQ